MLQKFPQARLNAFWGDGGFGYISKTPGKNCGLGGWVDVMTINYGTPNPTPPPSGTITLSVSLSDSYGDGWNSNILGFMQNDVVIATFGSNFLFGKSPVPNPINITIPNNLQTQIVVVRLGYYSNQVGFIIKYLNGTILYQRNPLTNFNSQTIFANFCPASSCVTNPTVNFYVTMTDSGGNGWQGTYLAFRQNGILQPFTLVSSTTNAIPLQFKFNRNFDIDIIVYQVGVATTSQIGFSVRTFAGVIAASRNSGISFSVNQLLGRITPNNFNLNFVPLSGQLKDLQAQRNADIIQNQAEAHLNYYKIAVIALSSILALALLTIGGLTFRIIKEKNERKIMPCMSKDEITKEDIVQKKQGNEQKGGVIKEISNYAD